MHIPKDNITDWEKCTCNMYNLQKWRIQNIQSPKISVKRQKKKIQQKDEQRIRLERKSKWLT